MIMARARRGFTLVELVIVLAVISLVAGMAVPRYAAASARYRVKAAARRIATDLEMARRLARAHSAPVGVQFTVATKSSYAIAFGSATNAEAMSVGDVDGVTVSKVQLWDSPYRVELKGASFNGVPNVDFSGYGVATTGSVVLATGGWQAQVQLEGETGVVTVIDP